MVLERDFQGNSFCGSNHYERDSYLALWLRSPAQIYQIQVPHTPLLPALHVPSSSLHVCAVSCQRYRLYCNTLKCKAWAY